MSVITSSPLADADALSVAAEVVLTTRSNGGEVRLLGGVAVALRCPSARSPAPLARTYSDVDLATDRKSGPALARALESMSYVPERRFNALHGHTRMVFDHPDGVHVDVFVDEFVMCHRLDLAARLRIDDQTVSLADLLLTKLQVAELNAKDVTDVAALLLDHELTPDDAGINLDYVTGILSRDWGWWRTVSHNLHVLPRHLDGRLPTAEQAIVGARLEQLGAAIDRAPKSLRWKARAKAGERIPWRDDPEESH